MTDKLDRSIEELWRDFEFLTKEIAKFIDMRNDELVGELIGQRTKLQTIIQERNDQTYHKTHEGKTLLKAILDINKKAAESLQQRYNHLKQQHKLSQAYDGSLEISYPVHYLDQDM